MFTTPNTSGIITPVSIVNMNRSFTSNNKLNIPFVPDTAVETNTITAPDRIIESFAALFPKILFTHTDMRYMKSDILVPCNCHMEQACISYGDGRI